MEPNLIEKVIMVYGPGEFVPVLIMRIDDFNINDNGELILMYENETLNITFEWSYFEVSEFDEVFSIDQSTSKWQFKETKNEII